jgi:hypothetical protein
MIGPRLRGSLPTQAYLLWAGKQSPHVCELDGWIDGKMIPFNKIRGASDQHTFLTPLNAPFFESPALIQAMALWNPNFLTKDRL